MKVYHYEENEVLDEEKTTRQKYKKYVDAVRNQISDEVYHITHWNVDVSGKLIFIRVDLSTEPKDNRFYIHKAFEIIEKEAKKKDKKELVFYVGSLPL